MYEIQICSRDEFEIVESIKTRLKYEDCVKVVTIQSKNYKIILQYKNEYITIEQAAHGLYLHYIRIKFDEVLKLEVCSNERNYPIYIHIPKSIGYTELKVKKEIKIKNIGVGMVKIDCTMLKPFKLSTKCLSNMFPIEEPAIKKIRNYSIL